MEEALSTKMCFVSLPGYRMKNTHFPRLHYDLDFGSTPQEFQYGLEGFMLDTFGEYPNFSEFVNVRCARVSAHGWMEFVAVFEYASRTNEEDVIVEGCYRHFEPMKPKDGLH